MCVGRIIGEETFFQKRVCESLDERYLFLISSNFENNHQLSFLRNNLNFVSYTKDSLNSWYESYETIQMSIVELLEFIFL